jgi:hypothetical protein
MEQLYDCKMVDNRLVVEHAHKIQALAKELKQFSCVLPDKFVAGGISLRCHLFRGFCYLSKAQETTV